MARRSNDERLKIGGLCLRSGAASLAEALGAENASTTQMVEQLGQAQRTEEELN